VRAGPVFVAGAALLIVAAAPGGRLTAGPPTCAPSTTRAADVGTFVKIETCAPFFRSATSYLPATFRVVSGALPPGLSLQGDDQVAAQVGGTPKAVGTYTFTIGASDALGHRTSGTYTIQVHPRLVFSGAVLPRAVMGVSYTATISASGGDPPYTYGAFSMNGISLDSSSGALAGTVEPKPANGVPALVCGFTTDVTDASGARVWASFSMPVYDQDGSGPYNASCAASLPSPFVFVSAMTPRQAAVPAGVGRQPAFVRAVPVAISGRGLGDVVAVTFAGRAASFTSGSDTALTAFAPVGVGSGAIVLTTYDGHTWKAGAFTVTR
jgi:Putative Ig domain